MNRMAIGPEDRNAWQVSTSPAADRPFALPVRMRIQGVQDNKRHSAKITEWTPSASVSVTLARWPVSS